MLKKLKVIIKMKFMIWCIKIDRVLDIMIGIGLTRYVAGSLKEYRPLSRGRGGVVRDDLASKNGG